MNLRNKISIALAVLIGVALLAGSFGPGAARADPRHAIQGISPIFEIYSDTLKQNYMAVSFNPGTASYLVVWNTWQDNFTADLWARPVFMNGSMGPVFNIDSIASNIMDTPALAGDPLRGRFLVVYYLYDGSGTYKILVRTVSYNGNQIGPPITITSEPSSSSGLEPSVVFNPHRDEYLLVYGDTSDPACSYSKLLTVRINAETLSLSTPVEIGACTTDEYYYNGQAALHPVFDQYQLVYALKDEVNSTYYLMTRWLSGDLSQIGAPVEMNNSLSNIEMANIDSGMRGYLATYIGQDLGGHMQIYGQFINPDGFLQGGPIQIPVTMNAPLGVGWPRAAYFGSMGYIVTWGYLQTSDPADTVDLYYRLVPERPEPPQTVEKVLADGPGNQGLQIVSCVRGVQCLMVFQDDSSGDEDIFARQLFIDRQMLPFVMK
jgi:hypothetical protein